MMTMSVLKAYADMQTTNETIIVHHTC